MSDMARQLISEKYPNILFICYMTYHLNLITANIIKLDFAKNIFKKYQVIIFFFKTLHYVSATLEENLIKSLTEENNLKYVVKTQPKIFHNASTIKNYSHPSLQRTSI
ncbi:hypothetical protein C1645_833902 [Glomus cerebriforme]|uniref:DUF659 domain-containing protein n=1 Tax=Glomus cerebriforme TaxID=658196 RepID=A0A397SBP3_9GLOM|nr:hypothetical protein C1645_833902 [Glomus cerebriforme]